MANGGLGIRKLTAFNKAFLGTWFWRFGFVIVSKFGEEWMGVGVICWVGVLWTWSLKEY